MYHTADHIGEFYDRIRREAERITEDYEIIFVNDGSPDASLEKSMEIFATDNRVVIIDLSRNFGHHKAMMVVWNMQLAISFS
jgi:putative glycosyltransferase